MFFNRDPCTGEAGTSSDGFVVYRGDVQHEIHRSFPTFWDRKS